jgi:hypothetical protein
MLLSNEIKIEVTNNNLKYHQRSNKSLEVGDILVIKLDELSINSGLKVDVKCDYCGFEFKMEYRKYLRSIRVIEKNSCKNISCSNSKVKESNNSKYGVSNVMQITKNKDKAKNTNIEKYGVSHPMQLDEFKEKVKETNLIRYGCENPMQLDEFKEKVKETNLIRYGCENPMQLDEFKEKVKETNLIRYGFENYTQTEDYKILSKETNLIKYGVDNYSKTEECKLKIRKTNLERYGFEYLFESEEFRDSIKESNLDKYGVEYFSQTDEFSRKSKETSYKRFGVDNPMKSEKVKQKLINTFIDKYGVDNPNKLDSVRDKIKKTNLELFGFEHASQSPIIKDKIKKTNIGRTGVSNIMYNEVFRRGNFIISKHPNYLGFIIDDKKNEFKCDCGGDHKFRIYSDNFYKRIESKIPLCTICYPIGDNVSIKESELLKFINSIYMGDIIQSYRDGLEIDIYLPDLKLGFEFNGLYWHSDNFKEKGYHLEKLNHFKSRGIRIINIWEDDWTNRNDIIKSQIINIIGLNSNRIFARNCYVEEVSSKISKKFLNENHIQGWVNSNIKIGLYHNGELVSLITFDHFEGRKKMNDNEWNLNRFCNKLNTNVLGGASKLLKYFINKYNPKRIISYADKDWSVGNLYEVLNFEKINETSPDYKYFIDGKRVHKSRYRMSRTGISESKIDLLKIWDCGKIKYEYILKTNINI